MRPRDALRRYCSGDSGPHAIDYFTPAAPAEKRLFSITKSICTRSMSGRSRPSSSATQSTRSLRICPSSPTKRLPVLVASAARTTRELSQGLGSTSVGTSTGSASTVWTAQSPRPVTPTSTIGVTINSRSMSGSEGVVFIIDNPLGSSHSTAARRRGIVWRRR